MKKGIIKFGTRGSLLAKIQTEKVAKQFSELYGWNIELVVIKTEGDDLKNSITNPSRPGVFVSALRDALLNGAVDVLVHSYKDLPSAPQADIALAAVPEREDSRDVLISKDYLKFNELPSGFVIGTSSPRRKAFVKFNRPDLNVMPIRGNVDSRIEKIKTGDFDAILMAAAGLNRINRKQEITEIFETTDLIPAPAQGALAIECKSSDEELRESLKKINDVKANLETHLERSFLKELGASCQTAVGAVAEFNKENQSIRFSCELMDENGAKRERRVLVIENDVMNLSYLEEKAVKVAREILDTELGREVLNR
jgi:hydroxymethylbilane synthase